MKSTVELFQRCDAAGISQNELAREGEFGNTTVINWRKRGEGTNGLVDRANDVVTELIRKRIALLISLLPENANTGDTPSGKQSKKRKS